MANTPFQFKFDNPVITADEVVEDWVEQENPDEPELVRKETISYYQVTIDGQRHIKKVTQVEDYKAHCSRPLPLTSWSTEIY